MKPIQVILVFLLCLKSYNQSYGQTQLEINQEEKLNYLKADKELNKVYSIILKQYQEDTVFIKNFKNEQRLWIQFRDAEMKSMFPDRENGYYGSIHPMCWSIYLTELTKERTKKLNKWLEGADEGDSCTSSIKTKN